MIKAAIHTGRNGQGMLMTVCANLVPWLADSLFTA